jgi:uncharacterized Zn finger protein
MKLKDLSESVIKKFSGATIFGRGKDYCQSQMVDEIKYDAVHDRIEAEVNGSSGSSYDVEITAAKSGIDATCSCPFDGYPCKHIVAVLLTFMEKQETLMRQSVENKKKISSLKERIQASSKERLAEILLSLVEKYPDCQRDLLIEMGDDPHEAVSFIRKQIHQIFRAFESDDYASSKVVKQLKSILRSIHQSSIQIRAKGYWAVSDRILKELNEYGMNDEPLEDLAIETLDLLAEVLSNPESSQEEKTGIVRALRKYSEWGNCGIIDSIDEAIERIQGG